VIVSPSFVARSRAIIRKGVMFAFLSAALVLSDHAVAKDEFQYDPGVCKTDPKGHLYIALGRNVFSVPFLKDGVYGLYSVLPKAKRLARDPSEPEGCPGNPSQQRSFAFNFGAPLVDSDEGSVRATPREAPTRVTLFEVWNPNSNPDREHSEWSGESAGLAQLVCAQATARETLPNGLTACRAGAAGTRVEDWGASYISDPSRYATPLGRRFIVDCGPGLYSGPPISQCQVAYAIKPDLAVEYLFQPYVGPSPIPIDHIIEFDRKIRAQIEAATVKDFVWPDQHQDNSESRSEGGKR